MMLLVDDALSPIISFVVNFRSVLSVVIVIQTTKLLAVSSLKHFVGFLRKKIFADVMLLKLVLFFFHFFQYANVFWAWLSK